MAKILIVDDSGLSRRLLRRILEQGGHQVSEAVDGLSALERYALERPDLVLLDLTMTGMHGLDVLHQLRELDEQAAIIIATADIQSSTRLLADAGGASGYLTKPFVAEEVLDAIGTLLVGGQQ